jgi:hypothetical protein
MSRVVLPLVVLVAICFLYFGTNRDLGDRHTVNNGDVYYKNGITKDEAEKLGRFLVREKYFEGGRKSVQLTKNANKYLLRFVIKPDAHDDLKLKLVLQNLAGKFAKEELSGAEIEIELCDRNLVTIQVITPK